MIEITPAILTKDKNDLSDKLKVFLRFGNIDIDIVSKSFADNETLPVGDVITDATLDKYEIIGFHLMVNNPQNEVETLLNSSLSQRKVTLYISQNEELLESLSSKIPSTWQLGVFIKKDEEINSLEFYSHFDEVQFMTVEIGFQGGEFDLDVLEKVDRLRSLGYNGKVSLDGGVNVQTAGLIRSHKVDRVSVGSYLSESIDPKKSYDDLYQALNS